MPDNFRLHPQNGITIKTWLNDSRDTALRDLIPVLKEAVSNNPEDVRVELRRLRDKYSPAKVKYMFDLPSTP
jgi:TFIIF-interacting CTD phosphatase-like protein